MRTRTITLAAAATAFAAITLLAAAGGVRSGDYIPVPAAYRFTGIVGTLASPASHAIFVGDGFSFSFSDKGTPPVKAYRLCLYRNRAPVAFRCWRRHSSREITTATASRCFRSPASRSKLAIRLLARGRVGLSFRRSGIYWTPKTTEARPFSPKKAVVIK